MMQELVEAERSYGIDDLYNLQQSLRLAQLGNERAFLL